MLRAMNWITRGAAALSCAILLLIMAGSLQESRQLPTFSESVGLAFFPIGVMLGMIIGFRYPIYGGCVTLVSLIAFYSWHVVVAEALPSGPFFALFGLPGLMFLAVGWLSNRQRSVPL